MRRTNRSWRTRFLSLALAALLGTSGAVLLDAAPAQAAEQNGYVFNDPWTLTGPSVQTQYSTLTPAHNTATTQIPSSLGAVTINAQFTPNPGRNAGASFLTGGSNQSAYGATSGMFIGTPDPAAMPALGLLTNGSQGCGGALGSAGHQNFSDVCNVGSLTLEFSQPMTDMVLDISGLGGNAFRQVNSDARASFNSTIWTITSGGVSFSAPSAGATNLLVDSTSLQVNDRNSYAFCNQRPVDRPGTTTQSPQQETAGCGSVILQGTFSSVTFQIDSMATPFSAFPTATHGTGSAFFRTVAPYADGINGLNLTPSEPAILGGNPVGSSNSDLQRISFRLPELGQIGDTVWRDMDRDGIQDEGEPGVAGVTATLTDADGVPLTDGLTPITTTTDANGRYLFDGIPFGDYRVEFSNFPDSRVLTTPDAGADDADSDADPATGLSGVVHLSSAAPSTLDIDAGLVDPVGSIGDRVWVDSDRDGVQGEGEPGLAGVTVVLYDAFVEVDRTTTAADGSYLFTDLLLADYWVEFSGLPQGHTLTLQGAGTDTALDSDPDPDTGRTDVVSLHVGARDHRDVDAGVLAPLGSIGDRVWADADRDGIQDDGETGIADATVVLYDAVGAEVARTTSAADGSYLFPGLELGDYTVEFTGLPQGSVLTSQGEGEDTSVDSDPDPATGRTPTVSLVVGVPDRRDIDAGVLAPLGSIGDRVWNDLDGDGVQDEGEPGVGDVTVILLDALGAEIGRTISDPAGAYRFGELPMGAYSLQFTDLPPDFQLTVQGAGDDASVDSDADPTTGSTAAVVLSPATPDVTDIDAGVVRLGSIGDRVWQDLDADGIQDAGEPGVGGITVTLLDAAGTESATTVTAADGAYLFDGLPAGTYSVLFGDVPADMRLTQPGQGEVSTDSDADPVTGRTGTVTLTGDVPDVLDVDAGFVQLGSIGDVVWLDEDRDGLQGADDAGVPAVIVVLYDGGGNEVARTTTDADGAYLFDRLELGDYVVAFESLPTAASITVQGAGDDPALDSDASPATGRTDVVSLTADVPHRTDVDAGVLPPLGSIGDRLWIDQDDDGLQDEGEPGAGGLTVVLYGADGVEVARLVTDAAGGYLFENLPMGDYTVGIDGLPADLRITGQGAGDDPALDSDLDPTTARSAVITLTPEAKDRTDVDAGLIQLGSIGDRVWRDLDDDGIQDDGEAGVAGVTVLLYDVDAVEVAQTVTDADGLYRFDGLAMGEYAVAFEDLPAGLGFSPQGAGDDRELDSDADPVTSATALVAVSHDAPHVRDVDAGLVQLGSVGDRVWYDADGDGVQDEGEPGVGAITVVLYDADGAEVARTVTNPDGSYRFADLPMGDYAVGFTDLPADRGFAPVGAGDDPAVDSDVDPVTGRTSTVSLTNGSPFVTDVDAGLQPLGSIGDRVWRDLDDDGIQDDGEAGVEGVTVVLYDAGGVETARTVTDADGVYGFGDLPLGEYSVGFADLPATLGFSVQGAGDAALDSDAGVDGRTGAVVLSEAVPHRGDVDAGLVQLGALGDRVWSDLDGDGVQDEGEPGLAGVTVVLYDGDGVEVARTVTDADGGYRFEGLPMGDYSVQLTDLPAGVAFSPQGAGDDPALDSDVDPATGRSGTVSLTNDAPVIADLDAGLQPLGSIGDRVWRDLDDDGVQDEGEPGLEGVTVVLSDADGVEVTRTVTDADGAYLFGGLVVGTYSATFGDLPAGLGFSPQGAGEESALDSDADPVTGATAPVTISHDALHVWDLDAGLVQLGSVGDRVWYDADGDGVQEEGEPGAAEVTVVLYDADGVEVARTVTDADGAYRFEGLPMGDYSVEFTDLPEDLGYSPRSVGEDPARDSDVDPVTGRTSTVSLTNVAPNLTDVDAGLQLMGSIGDRVWRDLDDDGIQDDGETGVEGVTVVLYDHAGTEAARTVTDVDGMYRFEDLPMREYSVGFADLPAGLGFSVQGAGGDPALDSDAGLDGRTGAVLLSGAAVHRGDVDAGLVQLGSIGDRVWSDHDGDGVQDEGEPGVAGVTVVLHDAEGNELARTVTGDDGSYRFDGLAMGDYSVAFTGLPGGVAFSPQSAGDDAALDSDVDPATGRTGVVSLTNEVPSLTDVDAGLQPLGSIGDRVWRDLDDDGVQDDGEPGLGGVTVVLSDADGVEVARTVTDADGAYRFDDLVVGPYSVQFTDLPAGLGFSPQGAGDDPGLDSDPDPVTGATLPIIVSNDALHVRDVDAGLVQLGSVGDRVWRDADGDGVQDEGEPGVEGVTVVLYDADGVEVARTVTDAEGAYRFEGLPMGDYSVEFTDVPEGLGYSPRAAGEDRTLDSDVDPVTGRAGTVSLTNVVPNATAVDAGLQPLGSIGDRVWRDLDDDGLQDDGEAGVAGVTVVLYDVDGAEVARVVTNVDGMYRFGDLPLREYSVGFADVPGGLGFSVQGAGAAELDSDAGQDGRTGAVVLSEAVPHRGDVDAGLVQLGSIGDRVWSDLDGDGVQDEGEPGLGGVTVVLYDADGAEVARTVSGADGGYRFEGLPMGDYSVEFVDLPAGTSLSPQGAGDDPAVDSDVDPATGRTGTVSLTNEAPDTTDLDAGVEPQRGSIGSRVWHDRDSDGVQDAGEPGVPGVTVILYSSDGTEVARMTTGEDGAYLFTGVPLGEYELEFTDIPEGYAFTVAGAGGEETDSDVNPATGRVRVSVTADEPAQLHIDAGLKAVAPVAPAPSPSHEPDDLPRTGADAGPAGLVALAAMLAIAVGGMLVARRREESASESSSVE